MKLTQPIKWFGGKRYLAKKIVGLMPRHLHYVEPFAGGLSVLLERDPNNKRLWLSEKAGRDGVSEVVNDINGELMNFWWVLQHKDRFADFTRIVQAVPLSRSEFNGADQPFELEDDPVDSAVNFFIRARQSRSGQFKGFTSLTRNRTRRGINGNVSEWLGAVEGLPAVHARLQPVVMENMDAVKLIKREDEKTTLYYLDPPYVSDTRTSKDVYAHEMTHTQHVELLDTLADLKGKWMLSGYRSKLYDSFFKDFEHTRYDFELPNNAAGGKVKRRMTECLWCNFTRIA